MKRCPKALLLDMDGVLYHGDRALPHAAAFLHGIAHLPHLFVTNNPIASPEAVAERLRRMGLPCAGPWQILTSAEATARCLAQERPGFRYFAVGAPGLAQALARYGVADAERADYVVVGEGPGLDYDTLTQGINLILKQGARLVSTNPDTTVDAVHEGRHRLLPGGGALVAPFEVATGQRALSIGKPGPLLYRMALEILGRGPEDCIMVGDRVDTDIAGASALGMGTALVRSGRFAPGAPWPGGQPRADWDAPDLRSLYLLWRKHWPDCFDAATGLTG